jgi:hypothetical protein
VAKQFRDTNHDNDLISCSKRYISLSKRYISCSNKSSQADIKLEVKNKQGQKARREEVRYIAQVIQLGHA